MKWYSNRGRNNTHTRGGGGCVHAVGKHRSRHKIPAARCYKVHRKRAGGGQIKFLPNETRPTHRWTGLLPAQHGIKRSAPRGVQFRNSLLIIEPCLLLPGRCSGPGRRFNRSPRACVSKQEMSRIVFCGKEQLMRGRQ